MVLPFQGYLAFIIYIECIFHLQKQPYPHIPPPAKKLRKKYSNKGFTALVSLLLPHVLCKVKLLSEIQ